MLHLGGINFLPLPKYLVMRYSFLLFLPLFVFSCDKSDDVLPTLSTVSVNDNSIDVLEFQPGSSFVVRSTFGDNIQLGQFKIDIHQDFDGHSHKDLTTQFAEIRIKNIEGTQYNLEETFDIPIDASSGTYHGTIRVLDKEGNMSEIKTFYFNIVRDNQPTISMNLPASVSVGNLVQILGEISAQGGATLKTVKIRIRSSLTGNKLMDQAYPVTGLTTWNPFTDGNASFTVPQDETEKLFFRLWVEDSNGNFTIFESEIIIV